MWVGYNLISNQLSSFVKNIFVLKNWGNEHWLVNDSDSFDKCNFVNKVTIFFLWKKNDNNDHTAIYITNSNKWIINNTNAIYI